MSAPSPPRVVAVPPLSAPAAAGWRGPGERRRRFYVGAPEPSWLARTRVPLFVSHVRLRRRRTLPRAMGRWALDSGGFSELARHGRWTITPGDYVTAVRRYREEIGGLDWAAPMDWMCEPAMLGGGAGAVGTGLTVAEHQHRTVENFLELRSLAPELPIVPVIQGWTVTSYLRCVEMYQEAGVDLAAQPRVGVGSVCRRPTIVSAAMVFGVLHDECGLRNLHGFGLKCSGLAIVGDYLSSADSMAWSFAARARGERCPEGRRDCRNCRHYAEEWRAEVLTAAGWDSDDLPLSAGLDQGDHKDLSAR